MNCPTAAMPDRWALMTLILAGAPIPVLPPIRGRRHRVPWDSGPDHCALAWELLHGPAPAPLPPPRPRWATLGDDGAQP